MAVLEEEDRYVSPSWVAEWYGVSRATVYRAIRDGRLKAVRVWSARGSETWVLDRWSLPFKLTR